MFIKMRNWSISLICKIPARPPFWTSPKMDQLQSKIKTLAIKDENKRDKEGFVIPTAAPAGKKAEKPTVQQGQEEKRWRYFALK
jgi:hypothetical protein